MSNRSELSRINWFAYAGAKKYGDAANLPARTAGKSTRPAATGSMSKAAQGKPRGKFGARARKPTLDEMGPGMESKIFQPTNSRQSGPEFGPTGRSSGGAPGKRGGWKKK